MLMLATPGNSIYSVVPVAKDAPVPCEHKHSPLCRKPWYSTAHKSYVRVETAAEARKRWTMIAGVASDVTAKRAHLLPFMLTVTYHESGAWRRDVHEGVGKWSRGDCLTRKRNGRDVPIPGTCRSICLGQIMKTKRTWKTERGYRHESLAGLSRKATRRCLVTVADYLDGVHKRCKGEPYCVFGGYGGVRKPRKHPRHPVAGGDACDGG